MRERPRSTQEMLRGLGFAEYVVGAFEKSAVFYWRMWGPLGGPMIRATEQWADMQRRYLRSLRREGPAAAPRGAAADGGSAGEAEGAPREEIRSIIRESVRRSQEGVREEEEEEEPQDGSTPAPEEGRADAEEPPVEDYDSLSVGQVNQRLLELSVEEVEQMRDYEAAHRNRPSIMNRYERRLRVARENREGEGAAGAAESSAGGEG
jgi:hypothetical protein